MKIKFKRLRTFLLFVFVQSVVLYMGIFPWTTLSGSVAALIDLCKSGDLFYIPDLMLIVWKIVLIFVTVVFGVIGAAVLLFEIGTVIVDLIKVLRSENKAKQMQKFCRFYKAIIFG